MTFQMPRKRLKLH